MDAISNDTSKNSADTNARNLAALGYVWILSVPVFWMKKDDAFIGPHARQGMILFALSIGAWFIPYINHMAEIILGICMIIGYFQASHGRTFTLPWFSRSQGRENMGNTFRMGITRLEKFASALFHPMNQQREVEPHATTKDISRENEIAACAYLWIASVLVFDRYGSRSRLIASHARQAMVIFLLSVVFFSFGNIGLLMNVILLLASVAGFISALSGKELRIPLIAFFAEKLPSLETLWSAVLAWIHQRFKRDHRSLAEIGNEVMSNRRTVARRTEERTKEEKTVASCCYFFLGPLLATIHRRDAFVRFHAVQGIMLNILFLALYIVPVGHYSSFIILSLMILGASKAQKGETYPVPLGYELAQGATRMMSKIRKQTP